MILRITDFMPKRVRRGASLILLFSVVVASVGFSHRFSNGQNEPEFDENSPRGVLKKVMENSSRKDLAVKKKWCTAKGFRFFSWCVSRNNKGTSSYHDWVYGKPIESSRVCDIPVTYDSPEGESKMIIHMINKGGWKFDDVYYATSKGERFGLWGTEIMDHPYLSVSKLFFQDIKPYLPFMTEVLRLIP